MKKETVYRDNAMFFVVTVGISICMEYFAHAVFNSSREMAQFPTDNFGNSGYIRIDSSAIREKGESFWFEFVEKIKGGLFSRVSYRFSSITVFEGEFAEQVTLKENGYTFFFHIKQYERDSAHNFLIINSEDVFDIPEDEKLGRVVYLTITTNE